MAITRRLEAIQDLIDISDYLAQSSATTALRFLRAAEATFRRLHQFPRLGRPCLFRDPALHGTRRRLFEGWTRYLIYYRPTDTGIEVLRILDGRRDIGQVFGSSADGP
jgi:toxin ParE1/3/4